MTRWLVVAVALVGWARAGVAQQGAPEQHLRGEVVSVSGDTVELKTKSGGTATFKVADSTKVSVASKSDLSHVKQDSYVGTTAVAQPDGTLRALEVHIFPEGARGAGEGHRPWDLQAGSSMTNATVAGMGGGAGGSSMTNATVASAEQGGRGMRLTLRYKDGEKTVVVPEGTTVVQLEPADRSKLVPGAKVFAAVKADAAAADRVTVGKDVTPPM